MKKPKYPTRKTWKRGVKRYVRKEIMRMVRAAWSSFRLVNVEVVNGNL